MSRKIRFESDVYDPIEDVWTACNVVAVLEDEGQVWIDEITAKDDGRPIKTTGREIAVLEDEAVENDVAETLAGEERAEESRR